MERSTCGESKDLLMIQNKQAHLWSMVVVVSWLVLAWLLLEQDQDHYSLLMMKLMMAATEEERDRAYNTKWQLHPSTVTAP